MISRLKWKLTLHKLVNWEYWPFWAIYWVTVPYWVYLCICHKSFFFFTASNPSIDFGGMLGEAKDDIFKILPKENCPITKLVDPEVSVEEAIDELQRLGLSFPIICKPNVGERGWRVKKVKDMDQFQRYHNEAPEPYLIQEYIDLPIELGVFYYRLPNAERGVVSSIVEKGMLQVTGDGKSTVKQLMQSNLRAMMQLESLESSILDSIPDKDEIIELVAIGNHCKGTTFLNGEHYINDKLTRTFDAVAQKSEGFFFGRYDLRCGSIEELENGVFKILELNGAGAEPGHIYHPGRSLLLAYRDIFHHLSVLSDICLQNHKRGVPYWTFKQGFKRVLALGENKKVQKRYA